MITIGNVLENDIYIVDGCDCVSNAYVYGLYNSVRAAKFPKSTDITSLNGGLTSGIANLAKSPKGEGHDNWLLGVILQADFKFTNKVWVEMERYHFLDIVSSQSTMHKIAKFDIDSSYIKYVDPKIVEIMKKKIESYNKLMALKDYDPTTSADLAEKYLEILYSNPAGFTLTARVTTNYRQLKTIYSQRKNHRLPEWQSLCTWMKTNLPNSDLITGQEVAS